MLAARVQTSPVLANAACTPAVVANEKSPAATIEYIVEGDNPRADATGVL